MIHLRVTGGSRPDCDEFMNCPLKEGVLIYYNSSLLRVPCPSPVHPLSTGSGRNLSHETSAWATLEASWSKVTIS